MKTYIVFNGDLVNAADAFRDQASRNMVFNLGSLLQLSQAAFHEFFTV